MQAFFADCVKLVGLLPQAYSTREEQYQGLGLDQPAVFEAMESIWALKGDGQQKLENLLSQMHHAQLINFDYKFAITTSDSMIAANGKCLVNLKLDLLDTDNKRKSVYVELTLNQFYQFFHELKKAYNLMSTM